MPTYPLESGVGLGIGGSGSGVLSGFTYVENLPSDPSQYDLNTIVWETSTGRIVRVEVHPDALTQTEFTDAYIYDTIDGDSVNWLGSRITDADIPDSGETNVWLDA